MKKLSRLPKNRRNLIGIAVAAPGLLLSMWLCRGDDAAALVCLPFMVFFVWLCPEVWGGE